MGSQEGGSLSLTGEPVGENPKQGKPAFLTQRSKTTVSCVAGSVEKEKRRKTASFAAFEQAEREGKKDAAKPK